MTKALILLSGGLDSVALLHLARETYEEIAAVTFGYGQVNRDAETTIAGVVADRRGVRIARLELADAVGGLGLLVAPAPGVSGAGVSRANLPGRNAILISVAAAHATQLWPGGRIDLLMGATLDDAAGFPDCRQEFVDAMSAALKLAMVGLVEDIAIRAPWASGPKADVIAWCASRRDALEDIRVSVSCYRGTRCGVCDACTLRATAFASCKVEDGNCSPPAMFGGDAAREARFL